MPLFDDSLDTVAQEKPASSLFAAPSSGIGLAPPSAPAGDFGDVSGMGKLGLVLQSFGSGMAGKPNPVASLVEEKRKDRLAKVAEFKLHLEAAKDGVEMSRKLPAGTDRETFMDSYSKRMDSISPGLGDMFRSLGKSPDVAKMLGKYADVPAVQMSLQMDPSGQSLMKLIQSPEFMKGLEHQLDQRELPVVQRKVQMLVQHFDQVAPPEMVDKIKKDGVISASEVRQINDYVRNHSDEKLRAIALDDAQFSVLNRNDATVFGPLGILPSKSEASVAEATLKKRGEEAITHPEGRKPEQFTRDEGGSVVTYEMRDGKAVKVSTSPKFKPSEGDAKVTPATISVNGKNVAAFVDKAGNYYDANTKQPIPNGIGPQLSAEDERRNRELEGRQTKLDNMRDSATQLAKIVKDHPQAAAGLFSAPAKGIEYVAGSLNPGGKVETPATTAIQLRNSLVGEIGGLSKSSNEERRRLESTFQIGPSGNPANLAQGLKLLENALAKEQSELDAARGRPQPGERRATERRAKDYSGMSNEDLLKAITGK